MADDSEVALGISPRLPPLLDCVDKWLHAMAGAVEQTALEIDGEILVRDLREALRDAQQQRTELEEKHRKQLERLGVARIARVLGQFIELKAKPGQSFEERAAELLKAEADLSRLTEARDTLQSRVDDLEGIIRRHNRG